MRGNSERSRALRQRSTRAEQLLWAALRNRRFHGLKFRRQHAIDPYVVDFACLEMNLVVKIDGGYHEFVEDADRRRQAYLEELGFQVLRFTTEDVLTNTEGVLIAIERLAGLGPSP